MDKVFSDAAWEDYQHWIDNDRKILHKINELLRDIERNGHTGLGKPEALKHNLEGFWSRRITDEHRMVYCVKEDTILIMQLRHHYDD